MSIETVRPYLAQFGKEGDIMEFSVSSATVELAAQAVGVEPARIAKTLSFESGKEDVPCILIVTAGDAKIDNSKFKQQFGMKAKMLSFEDALLKTGHAVGGVCPFANPEGVLTYLDVSLKRFPLVYPACGSSNSAIPLTWEELMTISHAQGFVDVCKGWA